MKVGRRAFIKFLGSAVAGTTLESLDKLIQTDEYYIDPRLGFGFRIPRKWHLKAFVSFDHIRDKQILAKPFQKEQELLAELSEGLVAILSKYPIDGPVQDLFSPSVTFFMAEADEELRQIGSVLDISRESIKGFSTVLTDYECYLEPELIQRKGYTMVRSKSKFLFEYEGMTPTMIDNETLYIDYNDIFYTIHLYDSPYNGDVTQNEFDVFKESLHLL